MTRVPGHQLVRVAGVVCIALGTLAWTWVGWAAVTDLDGLSATSREGGRMVGWGITGTVVMITGMVILHFGQDAAERDARGEQGPPAEARGGREPGRDARGGGSGPA